MNEGTVLAKNLFQKIVDIKPTRAKLGHGSFITIDFGRDISEQIKTRNGPVTRYFGEWHLWVYMCAWRIDKDKKPFVGSEDSREKIENSLSELAARDFKGIEILDNAFDAKLHFGSDMELHLFSFYTEDETQWMLFTPENKVFNAGPNCKWSYCDSDKS